jgi:hypothetical protein
MPSQKTRVAAAAPPRLVPRCAGGRHCTAPSKAGTILQPRRARSALRVAAHRSTRVRGCAVPVGAADGALLSGAAAAAAAAAAQPPPPKRAAAQQQRSCSSTGCAAAQSSRLGLGSQQPACAAAAVAVAAAAACEPRRQQQQRRSSRGADGSGSVAEAAAG